MQLVADHTYDLLVATTLRGRGRRGRSIVVVVVIVCVVVVFIIGFIITILVRMSTSFLSPVMMMMMGMRY